MNELESIIQSTSGIRKINNQFSELNSIVQILKSHQAFAKQFDFLNTQNSFLRSVMRQSDLQKTILSTTNLGKVIAFQSKINIPTTAFDTIAAIGRQHNNLFSTIRNSTDSWQRHNSAFSQINSLQLALTGISRHLTTIAATQNKWGLLSDFEQLSEQAVEITNNIVNKITLTEEESERFETIIEQIFTFIKKNKKFGTYALLFISVIVNLMNIHQYYYFVKNKSEPVTTQDLAKFERRILDTISEKLKEGKEYRTTNRICKVYLKKQSKSMLLATLPMNFDVIVLQSNHKWLYVSFVDPKDNLPQTGWIMKKYLSKNK